ncbi:hypothetical protein ACEF99_003597 [Salmonella enterica subsp. enterica serovar Newport]
MKVARSVLRGGWASNGLSLPDNIPDRFIRSRQMLRSRLRVMAFIAVSGFSRSQQPQRKSCFMAQSGAVLPPMLRVSVDISASWWISNSICVSAALRPVTIRSMLVEQITSVWSVKISGSA